MTPLADLQPDHQIAVRDVFGIDSDLMVPAFGERDEHVPEIDPVYRFNPAVTLAILAGFTRDRRVMVQGLHGTGKSTHIEQVAARLNWPCVRVNLDGHISRLEHSLVPDVSLVKAWKADKSGNLLFRRTARNFNPAVAMAGKVTVVEVEEVVETGTFDPDSVHLPGIYVNRIVLNASPEKRIEKRTITQKAGV